MCNRVSWLVTPLGCDGMFEMFCDHFIADLLLSEAAKECWKSVLHCVLVDYSASAYGGDTYTAGARAATAAPQTSLSLGQFMSYDSSPHRCRDSTFFKTKTKTSYFLSSGTTSLGQCTQLDCVLLSQELVSDVITQQTRLVNDALVSGVDNGWSEAVEQLLASPRRSPVPNDAMSSDAVNSMIKQFQPIPAVQQSVQFSWDYRLSTGDDSK